MKFNQLSLIVGSALLCLFTACSKTKDDPTPVNNPPNNPTDTTKTNNPTDTTKTNNPPKPIITFTDFTPTSGYIGDTITLTGNNLDANNLDVAFGHTSATVISRSKNKIQAIVPDDIMEANDVIRLSTRDTTVPSTKKFNLKAPVIDSISPRKGFHGQPIKIYGRGFSGARNLNQVAFGDEMYEANAITPGHTTLSTLLDFGWRTDRVAGKYNISVTVAGLKAVAPEPFEMLNPVIKNVNVTTAAIGSEVIVDGENFIDPNGYETTVALYVWETNRFIKTVDLTYITSHTNNQIKFNVPKVAVGNYKILVKMLGSGAYSTVSLAIVN